MQHTDRPDAELVELSRRGWAPAFAVLLHRYGPTVRATVADASDPTTAVRDTYLDAMTRLDDPRAATGTRGWLLDLAAAHTRDPREVPETATLDALRDDELDEIWSELDRRWPDGRRPRRRVPRVVRVASFVLLLVALAAAVPVIVFTALDDREDPVEELRAVPVEDGDEVPGLEPEPETDDEPGVPPPDDDAEVGDTLDLGGVTDEVGDGDGDTDVDAIADTDDGGPGTP